VVELSNAGLADQSFKKPWFFDFLRNQKTPKSSNFWLFGFLIFDFNDPELVKIYSLVFPFSFSIKLSLLTFTLWIIAGLANRSLKTPWFLKTKKKHKKPKNQKNKNFS
jgi:hypothetical protein